MTGRRRAGGREPTIALINVVFLMLVFFLVAGTVAPALDRDLTLVRTDDLQGTPPPDTLVLHADGRLTAAGADISAAAFMEGRPPGDPVRIVPDRDVPAARLVAVARQARAAGAGAVMIVTERSLP